MFTPELRQESRTVPVLIGNSDHTREMRDFAAKAAATDQHILLRGETGAGKDHLAKVIHQTRGGKGEFIWFECGSVPEAMLETELFGHTAGAFTDARTGKQGLIQAAKGGTLVISEVGEAPLTIQVKLLRLFEEKTFRQMGSVREYASETNIIATTNRDLESAVRIGKVRSDLYHRLNRISFTVQPLRARRADVEPLLEHFLKTDNSSMLFLPETLKTLREYPWPGNVRELQNLVGKVTFFESGLSEIDSNHVLRHLADSHELPTRQPEESAPRNTYRGPTGRLFTMEELKKDYLAVVLEETMGNKNMAARIVGVHRPTLYNWLKTCGLYMPEPLRES